MSRAARKWAERAFAARPVAFAFVRTPKGCRRTGCMGYHPTARVEVDEAGKIRWAWVTGHHAVVLKPNYSDAGEGVDALAALAQQLLRWCREVDPKAAYPLMGFRGGEEVWI